MLGATGYQDIESNDSCLYSKASDVFSAACIIYEMEFGRYLLCYSSSPLDGSIYVDALQNGRWNSFPPKDAWLSNPSGHRTNLHTIAADSAICPLLLEMINPRHCRISAQDASCHPVLLENLKKNGINQQNLDNGKSLLLDKKTNSIFLATCRQYLDMLK